MPLFPTCPASVLGDGATLSGQNGRDVFPSGEPLVLRSGPRGHSSARSDVTMIDACLATPPSAVDASRTSLQKHKPGSAIPNGNKETRRNSTLRSFSGTNRSYLRVTKLSRDRYIPERRSPTSLVKTFHMSKPLYQLSSTEKLLRQRSASPDPFSPTPRSSIIRDERLPPPRTASQHPNDPRRIGTRSTLVTEIGNSGVGSNRQASVGAVWNIGGAAATGAQPTRIPDGRGRFLRSGSNAPMYTSRFLDRNTPDQDLEKHQGRLALALDFDQANRILAFCSPSNSGKESSPSRTSVSSGSPVRTQSYTANSQTVWQNGVWVNNSSPLLLDAPQLRDDFYCSLLAYCSTTHSLAVGLSNGVFLWSEKHGVQPMTPFYRNLAYLTALSFSSAEGGHSILAVGRADGHVALWSLYDSEPKFEVYNPSAVACLSWKPRTTRRLSQRPREQAHLVGTEELLVGDEAGDVYYYSVEWSHDEEALPGSWHGSMSLLCRISVHTQQICGLAWSPDGTLFATGGNDNACCLFETSRVLRHRRGNEDAQASLADTEEFVGTDDVLRHRIYPHPENAPPLGPGREKHRWQHAAAVKAIAFCPWQKGLIATGGGSNDRCIHFYHADSGACLATISVAAQVTSLIWSATRREIAATFGYAQPEHAYRIAVFSWPECQQLVAIPWPGELRALYAIPYPGGPNATDPKSKTGEGGTWAPGTAEEGCIVVAASDESVKFHEVWGDARRGIGGGKGLLGGSDILEGLHGIDKEGGATIR